MGIQAGTIGKIFLPCDTIQERSVGPHNKRNSSDSDRKKMRAGFRHNENHWRKEIWPNHSISAKDEKKLSTDPARWFISFFLGQKRN